MIFDIVPIPNLRFKKVQYYTVRFKGKELYEFRDFHIRMGAVESNRLELGEIYQYIQNIGEKFGALPHHFRAEDAAEALPPSYHQFIETDDANDFGIRLYCIRLSRSVVILLNGDRKTTQKVKDCKNCFPHFDRARRIAKKLNQLILDGLLKIDEATKTIDFEDDEELSI